MGYVEFVLGSIAAVAMTVRILVFFTAEQPPRKSRLTAVKR